MSDTCPICRGRKTLPYEYRQNHSQRYPITVHETCRCQADKPTERQYYEARGVCDRMASDGDTDALREYVKGLHPMLKPDIAKLYGVKDDND